jgi:hypothetical protein
MLGGINIFFFRTIYKDGGSYTEIVVKQTMVSYHGCYLGVILSIQVASILDPNAECLSHLPLSDWLWMECRQLTLGKFDWLTPKLLIGTSSANM